jgi:2-deoxy-D-gluconate 3-dehydrogenase
VELFSLKEKVPVVTGGNGGIGLGIARGLAAAGSAIVVTGVALPVDGGLGVMI